MASLALRALPPIEGELVALSVNNVDILVTIVILVILTLRLLSFILFQVFLSVLFEAAKSTKNARHRAFYSFAPFAHKLLCNILRPSQTRRSCLNVPISGMEQLASRTTGNVWHTRSNNLHSVPLLELTLTVSLTVPDFI